MSQDRAGKQAVRRLRREFDRGFRGRRWRWRKHTDAGICRECRRLPRRVIITTVYRGTRWRPHPALSRCGAIYYTESLCLYHAAQEEFGHV